MDSDMSSIAIVGLSCALPSGVHVDHNLDYATLWDFLLSKNDAYEDIPADRFNIDAWRGPNLGQIKTTKGAFLKDATIFDHLEFGIPFQEAVAMSPSTRRLVEQSFLALLDSGIDYRGQNIGCFMSGTNPGLLDQDEYDQSGSFGGLPTMIANRVSYALDITGPSISLDTACSSSLSATHLAMQSILSGECDAALVGGCQYNHSILEWLNYSRAGVLAADGKSKPFDASGDGFARGEGVVVIVLKRLKDAIRDRDKIYANVLGSAINSTGSAYAPYVPVGGAQQVCIRRAFDRARRVPTDIDYLELHATGTAVGDPIEANAAGQMFKRDRVLHVGSIKGNLGHLEITAFLASVAKVCLMFEKRVIPPQANLKAPNPTISWQRYNMDAPTESMRLPMANDEGHPTLVGISSFGIGGSNGHVVLEAPPSPSPDEDEVPSLHSPLLLLAGGLSPRSATQIAASIKETIHEKSEDPALLSYSWGRRARQMTWRTFAIYSPGADLKFSSPVLVPRERPACIFVLSGQGPQHTDMGRLLYQLYRVFRDSIDEMDAVFEAATGSSLIATTGLFRTTASPKSPLTDSWPIAVTLPALAMYQCALLDLMKSVGVVPDVVVGHSAGETSLLYACGAASKAMVVELAIARGSAMSVLEKEHGTMAAISCAPEAVKKLFLEVGDADGQVEIACYNAPEAVSISGSRATIEKVVKLASDRGIFARVLRTNTPVHSSLMERCRDIYVEAIENVFARYTSDCQPTIPTYSTVTGQRHLTAFTPHYFWLNARQPVEFVKAIEEIHAFYANKAVIVEISPHPVLSAYVTSICGLKPLAASSRPSRDGRRSEITAFLDCLGQLSLSGYNSLDLHELTGVSGGLCPRLRSYPFTSRHVPFHADSPGFFSRLKPRNGPLCHPGLRVSKATHPDLADHVIHGQAIMPAAGFLEMAFEMGAKQLHDVKFLQALPLTQERPLPVEVVLHDSSWEVQTTPQSSISGPGFVAEEYRVHARGRLSLSEAVSQEGTFDVKSTIAKCTKVDIPGFMSALRSFSSYGPAFCRIQELYESQEESVAVIRGPTREERLQQLYRIEPSVVDAAFQACYQFLRSVVRAGDVYYLPAGCKHVTLSEEAAMHGLPDTVIAHAVFRLWTPVTVTFDIKMFSNSGVRLVSLTSFELERHLAVVRHTESLQRLEWCWQPVARQEKTDVGTHFMGDVQRDATDLRGDLGGIALGEDIHFFHLQAGEEDALRQYLRELDRNNMLILWLCTPKHPNGDAILGLGRSLSKEYPDWDVHVAMFQACESPGEREAMIKQSLPFVQYEPEVFFDETGPHVGRIIPATSPSLSPDVGGDSSNASLFDPNKSYLLLGGLGGLGIRIAVWMYERGARNMVLTSRSGVATLRRQKEPVIARILDSLRSLPDLNLRLEASDATLQSDMEALLLSITPPLAGCMVMTAVLADGLFSNQTNDDFTRIFEAKCAPFRLLARGLDIESLDFCIAFSSVAGLFGNGGQTNYASACTALDAMTEPYSRAFSLIVPGITDVGMFARGMEKHGLASSHLADWGMTSDELCDYIEDGIRALTNGPFTHYIPNLDWVALGKSMGIQPSFAHLVPKTSLANEPAEADAEQRTAGHIVQEFLQLSPEDFSPDVPFTHYGLDSLRAVRLSAALRPFGTVSQLQLLADMRLRDLDELFSQAQPNTDAPPPLGSTVARLGEAISDETIVKLIDDPSTPPLILIHGGGGSIQPFNMLKEVYGSALWAIQITPETPLSSIELMSQFYFRKIKELRPKGPYRLATFSASSIVGLYLARLFERAGDEVAQLAFLDHFPLILFSMDKNLAETISADGAFTPEYVASSLETMREVLRLDTRLPGRETLSENLGNLLRGEEAPRYVSAYRDRLLHFMLLAVRSILESATTTGDSAEEAFVRRVSGLKAPVSLYLASDGIGRTIPEHRVKEYEDFGIRRCYPDARVHRFQGGHFDILASELVARTLETEWLESSSGQGYADAQAAQAVV